MSPLPAQVPRHKAWTALGASKLLTSFDPKFNSSGERNSSIKGR